jgi:hypothetical protein
MIFLAYILLFIISLLGNISGSMQSPLKELLWMQRRRKESVCHLYVTGSETSTGGELLNC